MKRIEVWLKVAWKDGDFKVTSACAGTPTYLSCASNERWVRFDMELDPSLFTGEIVTGLTMRIERSETIDPAPFRARLLDTVKDLSS